MADSDDKTQDGAHKKTLTLKASPNLGARSGIASTRRLAAASSAAMVEGA